MGINTKLTLTGATADTIAPTLTSLSIPTSVNLSSGTAGLTISGTATDDLSGVDQVVVYFDKELSYSSQLSSASFSTYSFLGNWGIWDSWSDGTSTQTYGISSFNSQGIYNVTSVKVQDIQGNTRTYSPEQLAAMGINTKLTVIGATADITAPTVTTFSPADEASGVAVGSNIVVTFSEAITKGTGNIFLKTISGSVIATYDAATSSNLSFAGSVLTINPTADLNYSTGYKVELAPGSIKDLAGNSYVGTTSYNFTTVPSESGHIFTGTSSNESFASSPGNDTIDGGDGIDTVVFTGTRADHTVIKSSTGWTVASPVNGTDTIKNIERLKFSNEILALDIDGNAGQAYRIYQAAFNRTPDNSGLKYWIEQMDTGTSLERMAAEFIGSQEFQIQYGSSPTNANFLTTLYSNVLHRTPDQAGYGWWLGELNGGRHTTVSALASFSESAENKAGVIGVIQNGIELFY